MPHHELRYAKLAAAFWCVLEKLPQIHHLNAGICLFIECKGIGGYLCNRGKGIYAVVVFYTAFVKYQRVVYLFFVFIDSEPYFKKFLFYVFGGKVDKLAKPAFYDTAAGVNVFIALFV